VMDAACSWVVLLATASALGSSASTACGDRHSSSNTAAVTAVLQAQHGEQQLRHKLHPALGSRGTRNQRQCCRYVGVWAVEPSAYACVL
jgi:hypothetical protein